MLGKPYSVPARSEAFSGASGVAAGELLYSVTAGSGIGCTGVFGVIADELLYLVTARSDLAFTGVFGVALKLSLTRLNISPAFRSCL